MDDIARLREKYDDGTYPAGFWPWLADNMGLYRDFVATAHRAQRRGIHRWSARAILHVMRWESGTREEYGPLKINNNSSPGLARLAMACWPDLADFFETRTPPARAEAIRLDGTPYKEE